MSKVMEKIVAIQLSNYLEKNKLLTDYQGAYRKHRNCEMSVLQLQDKILKDAENGFDNSIILTDMSTAFDTVSHQVLLDKLKLYGLDQESLNWFERLQTGLLSFFFR